MSSWSLMFIKVMEASIQPLGEIFGLGKLEFQSGSGKEDFIRIWVKSNDRRMFSVDLTRIGGTVLNSEEVRKEIADSDQEIVVMPSADALLLQKCETFLERRIIKSRDAFDIKVLLAREAKLGEHLKAQLDDFIQIHELDSELIRKRIDRIDVELCTAELRPVLPETLFKELAEEDFKTLRSSLETVFTDWL